MALQPEGHIEDSHIECSDIECSDIERGEGGAGSGLAGGASVKEEKPQGPKVTERDRIVDRALAEVLAAAPEEREAALWDACGGDSDLRREVETMLRAAEEPDTLLRPGGALSPDLVDSLEAPPPAAAGSRIGRYRILRQIGHGGMGIVYLAERADGQFEQRVAIKLLRLETSEAQTDRFHRERQILARLEHPHIARLMDGGTTESGQPFLVMEYVEGAPIDRYCEGRRLPLQGRLELIRTVCEAVQAAHRQLIVHRDLKPANILVSEAGEVKLLDFGIARILAEDDPTGTGPTQTVHRALTPQYASPEQVLDQPVGVASDVYQIGLLAYELVSGGKPYDLSDVGPRETLRRICEQTPEPPSAVWDALTGSLRPPGLARPPADLDLILLQALRKEPERRYGSVDALREDLERFARGLPVSARKATWRYRASRFVRRNALVVGLTATALAAILGLAAAFTWRLAAERNQTRQAYEQAESERFLAEERRRDAEAVIDFLERLFYTEDPFVGDRFDDPRNPLQLLERGAEDIGRELADSPAVQARLLGVIGAIFAKRGQYARSQPLLERAVSTWRKQSELHGRELADSLKLLGATYLALGHPETQVTLEEALELQTLHYGAGHLRVAKTSLNLANLSFNQGLYEESIEQATRAMTIMESQPDPDGYQICQALVGIGSSLLELGRFAEARERFEEALDACRGEISPEHPMQGVLLQNLAAVRFFRGDLEAALDLFVRAEELLAKALGTGHPMVAEARKNTSSCLVEMGRLSEAEPRLREALEAAESSYGPSHLALADILAILSDLELRSGRARAAETAARRIVDMGPDAVPEAHPARGVAFLRLGAALRAGGRDEASEALHEAVSILQGASAKNRPLLAEAFAELAGVERSQGQLERAEAYQERAVGLLRRDVLPSSQRLREALLEQADLLRQLGREAEAAALEPASIP